MKKRILIKLLTLTFVLFILSCEGGRKNEIKEKMSLSGEMIYKKNCVACHGIDGRLQLNGAANLTESNFSEEEIIEIVTHGKKQMLAFSNILSSEEIFLVANYVNKLKNESI